jgi:glucose-6-phosphate 1-epimerase
MSNQTLQQLNEHFGMAKTLEFHENEHGLISASVKTATCTAEFYLQGAHLTKWQPTGHSPVLFLSENSSFAPGKAIRGGVPVIFPWFGARTKTSMSTRTDGPAHGFARTTNFQLTSAVLSGDDLQLIFSLAPDTVSQELGFGEFLVTYKITVGNELELEFIVENHSKNALQFEEAFHTYLTVGDVRQSTVKGLGRTEFIDKTDGFKRKRQKDEPLSFTAVIDRPYLNTEAQVDLSDPVLKRMISVDKLNSKTTVVWNPWSELTAKMSDMQADAWQKLLCIETANCSDDSIVLQAGKQHTMHARVVVKQLKA